MLARRLPTILPDLSFNEALEISKIYSIVGLTSKETPLILKRPFRSPHHTITAVSLVGGGKIPKPGRGGAGPALHHRTGHPVWSRNRHHPFLPPIYRRNGLGGAGGPKLGPGRHGQRQPRLCPHQRGGVGNRLDWRLLHPATPQHRPFDPGRTGCPGGIGAGGCLLQCPGGIRGNGRTLDWQTRRILLQ